MNNKNVQNKTKITLWRGVGFGVTDIMGGGYGALIGAYLMFFYTTYCGLTPVEVGSIFGVTRILDSVTAIIVGNLTDNFYKTRLGKKFGRRRFFLMIGSPLMLLYSLMWWQGMTYWFYFASFFIFDVLASVVMIPYETLPSEMTDNYKDRTIMSSSRMFFSGLTGAVMTSMGAILIKIMGDHNPWAYTILGTSFAIVFMIAVFITYKSTWERPLTEAAVAELKIAEEAKKSGKSRYNIHKLLNTVWNAISSYVSTLRVRAFRQHLAIYLLGLTGQDIFSTLFMYYVIFNLGQTASFGSALLSVGIVSLPLTPVWGWLFVKIGASKLYAIGLGMTTILLGGYYSLYYIDLSHNLFVVAVFTVSILYQLFKSLIYFTPWNIFPFIPDVDEIMTRRRREGEFAALMTFARKSTGGIAAIVIGAMLSRFNFKTGALTQTVEVQNVIANMLFFGVGGLTIMALILALFFKLNKRTHTILIDEINRLKNGGDKKDVTPEARKVAEQLSGVKYEKLWPTLPHEKNKS